MFNIISSNKYTTSRYYKYPRQNTDKYIIARPGDRLDLLAREFYQEQKYWWIIADANNLGKGTLTVPEGRQIRIPFPISNIIENMEISQMDK